MKTSRNLGDDTQNGPLRRHKLSVRLLGLFLITGVLLVVIIAGMFSGAWRYRFGDVVRPHLEQYVEYVLSEIGVPPNIDAAHRLATRLPINVTITGPDLRWSSMDEFPDESRIRLDHHHLVGDWRVETGELGRDRYLARIDSGGYRITFISEAFGDGRRESPARWIMISLVLLVLVGAWLAIRRMLLPIEALERGVTLIGSGALDVRVDVRRRDELGRLARSINRMAEDIQHMLEAKRELLLAISHELRSPLTRANVSLALLDDSPHRRELRHDLAEMDQLITELLEAERLNTVHAPLNLEELPLIDLIDEFIRENYPSVGVNIGLVDASTRMRLDPVRVKLMLKNIVSNALRHNRQERGPVTLSCRMVSRQVEIVVMDHGEGFTEEDLAHAAEPFWRGDRARQRATGGFGLGLYLSRRIAEAHGGQLSIESTRGSYTRVSVMLPMDAT